jgi:PTH2 family peptidyl-tRNA hydrolase
MSFKQVILVRADLKLTKGKMAAQVAHASVDATLKSSEAMVKKWRAEGMKKVCLSVSNKDELYKYAQQAKDEGLTVAIITDAGHTHLEPGTVTCAAVGPAKEEDIDKVTGKLKLIS